MDARAVWREVRATDTLGELKLGPNTFDRFIHDPRRLAFYGARYSLAAKILQDCASILDVGAGDGFFTTTFLTDTHASIDAIDFDEDLVRYSNEQLKPAIFAARGLDEARRIAFYQGDFLKTELPLGYGGIVSLDCIEHLDPSTNQAFMGKVYNLLMPHGIAVIGTPSEHAAHLGSAHSQLGHCNNFTPAALRALMKEHFPTVILMGMNDCVAHFGHESLWHYIVAVGVKS